MAWDQATVFAKPDGTRVHIGKELKPLYAFPPLTTSHEGQEMSLF